MLAESQDDLGVGVYYKDETSMQQVANKHYHERMLNEGARGIFISLCIRLLSNHSSGCSTSVHALSEGSDLVTLTRVHSWDAILHIQRKAGG